MRISAFLFILISMSANSQIIPENSFLLKDSILDQRFNFSSGVLKTLPKYTRDMNVPLKSLTLLQSASYLCDSSLTFNFSSPSDSTLETKQYYTYAPNDQRASYTLLYWDQTSQFWHGSRQEYKYDMLNRIIDESLYTWYPEGGMWQFLDEQSFSYTDNICIQTSIDNQGNVINEVKTETYEDSLGRDTMFIISVWDLNNLQDWIFSRKHIISYDENGNDTLTIWMSWNNNQGNWINSTKTTSLRNSKGELSKKSNYVWDQDSLRWNFRDETDLIYDSTGNVIQEAKFIRFSDSSNIGLYKLDLFFNEWAKDTLIIMYNWDSNVGNWVYSSKYQFIYDQLNQLVNEIYYSWNITKNDWIKDGRFEHTYNDNHRSVVSSYYLWDTILSKENIRTKYYEFYSQHNVKLDQTITFNKLAAVTYDHSDINLEAYASSGLPIQFSSSNPSVAVISEGTIHITGTGTTYIRASQLGNENFNPAQDVIQELVILKANQYIVFNPISDKTPASEDFDPGAIASSGLTVIYISSDTTIAAIVNNKIKLKKPGQVTITASQGGNNNYNPATDVSQTFTILSTGMYEFPIEGIRIYPIPASNIIHVESHVSPKKISLIDLQGKVLRTISCEKKINEIFVGDLPKGIYVLCITDALSTKKVKVVIQ